MKKQKNRIQNLSLNELEEYLSTKMSFNRLARVGLFVLLERPHQVDNELYLNRLVLDRALLDMFSPDISIREDVFNWLDINNKDFIFVCEEMCLLEPKKVLKVFEFVYKVISESRNNKNKKVSTRQVKENNEFTTNSL